MKTLLTKRQKDKWVEALLSGDYAQTKHVMRGDKGYCCLGVFCDLNGIKIVKNNDTRNVKAYNYMHKKLGGAGIVKASNGTIISGDGKPAKYNKLSNMNDTGISFKEIAKWIKRNIKTK